MRRKNHLGATVNDVVMTVCAGALRRYLHGHDALPAEALVAMVPISIRSGDEADIWTNRVSALVSTLPTDLDDPVERVHAMHETMDAAKHQFDMLPADLIAEFTQFAMPALATRAIRMAAAPHPRPDEPAGQPGHLQRPRSPPTAVPGGSHDEALLPSTGHPL